MQGSVCEWWWRQRLLERAVPEPTHASCSARAGLVRMATLQAQLAALSSRGPRALGVGNKALVRTATLLYTEEDARSIDTHTIFNGAVNGLLELAQLHPPFEAFSRTLFARSAMELDRTVQTESVNKQLDELIDSFLMMLSPYLLLKAAHKTIEFLLRQHKCVW